MMAERNGSARLKRELEAVLFAAGRPLSFKRLQQVFAGSAYSHKGLKDALTELMAEYEDHSIELVKVASGYIFHIRAQYADLVHRLTEEKPPRYSRALMETLAVITYRQPVTKAEIEELRGVTLSANIMRTLIEHGWIRPAGHKEVPGRPILWVTTKHLLDSLKLEGLHQLPQPVAKAAMEPQEIKDLPQGKGKID